MSELKVSETLQKHYDGYYQGQDEWRCLGAKSKAENVVALCQNLRHDSIIEIGAGEGSLLERLSYLNFGQFLYALEISQSGAEAINCRNIPRMVECRLFNGYSIPYQSDQFDLAILSHVIEHVEHPRQLITEAARVARYLFVEVPLEDTIRLGHDFEETSTGHINSYSPKTIRHLLQSCHLRVLAEHVAPFSREGHVYLKGGFIGSMNYLIKQSLLKMAAPLATHLFTYHSALVCEKT